MKEKKKTEIRSLNRSVTVVCVAFFMLLCLVSALATYRIFKTTMYDRYQKQLESIVSYVQAHVDNDDMAECARTYVESETYKAFQAFLDDMIDHYTDVHYIYLMQVLDPEAPVNIRSICSANSTYEKQYEPENVIHLGDGQEGWYDVETAREFRRIQDGDEDVFFVNPSAWGVDYTLARPVKDSNGEHYGLLCADVSLDELSSVVYRNINIIIAVIMLAGVVFIALLLVWMRFNVTKPIKLLEESVARFARTSAGKRNPDELVYEEPELRVNNEIKSLSMTMSKLAEDMRNYVKDMIAAEDQTRGLQTKAYEDALTKVKNKAAYDVEVERIERAIGGGKTAFGLAMIDLNYLKRTNDTYGHEQGNEAIRTLCHTICDVFKHSPVYRVGGDEFVVLLEGFDLEHIDALRACFEQALERMDAEEDPRKRVSAAAGYAVYDPNVDENVESVFKRADRQMYERKKQMKAERE